MEHGIIFLCKYYDVDDFFCNFVVIKDEININ